jgi:hypothetical protein
MKHLLTVTFPTQEKFKRFKEINRDYCHGVGYQAQESKGVWIADLYAKSYDEILELFYWLGMFQLRPTVFSTILN